MDQPENIFNLMKLSEISNIIIAAGTLILALVAIFGRSIRRWIQRPKLEVEGLCQVPHCRKTSLRDLKTFQFISDVYYFRLLVKNEGKSSAMDVEVYASELLKKKRDGTYTVVSEFTPDNLVWSNTGQNIYPTIPPKSERHCCAFHIVDPTKRMDSSLSEPMRIEERVFSDILPEKTIMHVDTAFKSNRLDFLQPYGEYRLKIIVSAGNSSSVVRKWVSINISGDWYNNEDQMLRDGVGFNIV